MKKRGIKMTKKRGFTIVELLIVLAIIGVLAVVYLPRFMGATDEAKKAADKSSAAAIANACQMYNVLNGVYPTPEQLCTTNLIDKKLLMPKYEPKKNPGYHVITGDGIEVYYSKAEVNEKSTSWGESNSTLVYSTK